MSTVSSGSGKGFWRKPCLVLDLKNKQAILRRAMSVCRCGINGLGVRCGSMMGKEHPRHRKSHGEGPVVGPDGGYKAASSEKKCEVRSHRDS